MQMREMRIEHAWRVASDGPGRPRPRLGAVGRLLDLHDRQAQRGFVSVGSDRGLVRLAPTLDDRASTGARRRAATAAAAASICSWIE
jgi:hypothetical protein